MRAIKMHKRGANEKLTDGLNDSVDMSLVSGDGDTSRKIIGGRRS